jgi:hypothetical protein
LQPFLFILYTVCQEIKKDIKGAIYGEIQSSFFPMFCMGVLADDEGKGWDASGGKGSRVFSWSEKEYFQDETAESMRGTCVVAVWWVGAS